MSSPTSTYRAQNGIAETGTYDPEVVAWVQKAAAQTGADPAALLATALQESGAQRGRVGDKGTSFGPFQFHRGGALGNHTTQWANTYDAVLNRAGEFSKYKVHGGAGAAAVQRPLDRALYAKGVDALLERARAILGESGAPAKPGATPTRPARETVAAPETELESDPAGDSILQALLAQNASLAHLPGASALAELDPGASPLQRLLSQNAALAGIEAPTLPTAAQTQSAAAAAGPSVDRNKTTPQLKVTGRGAGTPEGRAAVNLAKQYLGVKYQWGGESPKGFDCSGLLQYVWGKRGVNIPRVTYQQIKAGRPVALNQLQPGDAVFFGSARDPHHVGMAIGGGKFIEAPHTGATVRISSLAGRKDIVAARRFA